MSQVISSFGFGLVTASILSIAAVGFTLQFGVTNILNIAYGAVMTGCAFFAYYILKDGVPVVAAGFLSAAVGGFGSILLNRALYTPFIRRGTGLFGMIIVTISVGLIIQNVLLSVVGPNFFTLPVASGATIKFADMSLSTSQLAIIGIAVGLMIGVHLILRYTMIGKAMRAIASDANLARSTGISVSRVADTAWFISGALCGLAGVVFALNTASFDTTMGDGFLVVIIAAAILGGIGHPYGAMAGAFVIGVGTELAVLVTGPAYQQVVAFGILVVVLLFRPVGIFAGVSGRREVAA
jgi:branched-chain amino acid transport system permease protein/neutral amino acid transport system permease protein